MTLVGHLTELRSRVIRICFGLLAGTLVGFYVAPAIRRLLVSPLPSGQVQALAPGDAFGITMRIALAVGIAISMPVTIYQAWTFVRPGLSRDERRVFGPWLAAGVLLFVVGIGVAWFILPYTLAFLLAFTDETIVADRFAAGPYFDFVTSMFLGIGLALEFPVVLVGASRVGLVGSRQLRRSRRYAIVGIAIFAAIATPGGDVTAPAVLGVLMYVLFEATVFIIARSGR